MFTKLSITKIFTFEIRANPSAFTDNGSRWKSMYLHFINYFGLLLKIVLNTVKILTESTTFRSNITHAINGTQEN